MNNTCTSHYLGRKSVVSVIHRALLLLIGWLMLSATGFARDISGRVTDESGQALVGVSVIIKGSVKGTQTNADGAYTLSVPDNRATLVFSFIGYTTRELPVGDQSVINVTLAPNSQTLSEVVVVGYGTKERGALTGSIAQLNSKGFEQRPLTNALNALQGTIPGVTVVRGSGQPGRENYALQIRGYSSINGNRPLVLIDGVPSDLNTINPNDIDNVTVLKDAAASIYGARAADGVVIVTTKRGKRGVPSIAYSGNFGLRQAQFLKRMANTRQLAEMYDQGLRNIGQPGIPQLVFDRIDANAEPDPKGGWVKYLENYPGFYQTTDWNKEVYKTGTQQQHNINVSGGGENSTYLFSAGYQSTGGLFRAGTNRSDRYNLRLNYDFNIGKRLLIQTRTNYDNQITQEPSELAEALRTFSRAFSFIPVRNPQGQYYGYQNYGNPLQSLAEGGQRRIEFNRFATNFKADYAFTDNLKVVAQAGITLSGVPGNPDYSYDQAYYRTYNRWRYDGTVENTRNIPNFAYYNNARNQYKILQAYAEYNKSVGDHRFGLTAGTSHEENTAQGQNVNGYNFRSNDIFTLNLADRTQVAYANFGGYINDWALTSYFGRFSYGFANRFFLDATARLDGSSKFAPDKRWSAIFPAISAGWTLSNEKFLSSAGIFNNLKVRASWGRSGNQDLSFGNYDYVPLISIGGAYPLGSPNAGQPGAVQSIASTDRTWETIETTNVGLDFAVLKNRLSGSLDLYLRRNKNMLVGVNVPATLGGSPPTQNLGELETRGFELVLNWADRIGDVRYSVTGILNDSKNKLVELRGNDAYNEGLVRTRKGYPLNSYFGYDFAGIIQTQEQLDAYKKLGGVPANLGIGDVMYSDLDGDGKITAFGDPTKGTTGDMKYLGNILPRYTYSGNFNVGWKGFDINVLLQGVGQRQGVKTEDFASPLYFIWHQPLEYFYGKTWSPTNTGAKYPRIIPGGVGFDALRDWDYRYSANRVDNMAYLRVKVLTVGYNLPASLMSRVKMQSARIYLSGQDLFTFASKGGTWNNSYDPEEVWERSNEQTYPFSKVYSVGLDLRF